MRNMKLLYEDFLNTLKNNNLELKDIAPILGYSKNSISNNWNKDENIPNKALIALKMYLELQKERNENIMLKKQLAEIKDTVIVSEMISSEALNIANIKCEEYKIELRDYLSSLVISNI